MEEITPKNPLGIKSLADATRNPFIKNYLNGFTLDWVFDKFYEKFILVAMTLWSVYSLWRIFIFKG